MSDINLHQILLRAVLVSGTATACFTGCRPKALHSYEHDKYLCLVSMLIGLVLDLNQQGVGRFISGGAQGFDQLAFWSVNRAKVAAPDMLNDVYIPFPAQPCRWKEDGLFSRSEYQLMLRKANTVKTLSDDPDPNNFYQLVQKLHDRNHAMVDDSDMVIALLVVGYNDDWRSSKGGTAECIQYAVANHKPVLGVFYTPGTDTAQVRFVS